jgi:hypothetical protein
MASRRSAAVPMRHSGRRRTAIASRRCRFGTAVCIVRPASLWLARYGWSIVILPGRVASVRRRTAAVARGGGLGVHLGHAVPTPPG